jgi:hypothetical protein
LRPSRGRVCRREEEGSGRRKEEEGGGRRGTRRKQKGKKQGKRKYVRLDGGVHPVKRNIVIEAFSRKGR